MTGHEDCPSHAYQLVTCDRCGKTYLCTPSSDFYCTPEGDHSCERCLLKGMGSAELVVINPQIPS